MGKLPSYRGPVEPVRRALAARLLAHKARTLPKPAPVQISPARPVKQAA